MSSVSHISVPLGHRVYPILQNAEIRGIIDTGLAVRPYPTSAVLRYLETIKSSNLVTVSEQTLVNELIAEIAQTGHQDNAPSSMARYGSYKTHNEAIDTTAILGARLNFQFAQSISDTSLFDSRNGGDFYIRADIKNMVSIHMNIGLSFDHLEPRIFLSNDFTIPSEGKYDTFWDHGGEHILYYGIYTSPEISTSLFDDNLRLRWASINRDWGVGTNNLMLSGSARSFNAIEASYEISSWLRYAFITGALGKFTPKDLNDPDGFYDEYHFSDLLHETRYDNNFAAHRVEVDLPGNITFGIYESVVYRKRFEFGYLNPLSIIMYEQNIMGDFDNMLAGVDLEWTLPGIMRLYGAVATTEMSEIDPKRFFKAPRNIMGMQAGVDVNLPFFSFSSATLQYTYLAPFFYTHYPQMERAIRHEYNNDDGDYDLVSYIRATEELGYLNKGENLGYPLRPNSDEIMVSIDMNAPNGWDGNLKVKYQRRSGQYGFNFNEYMVYRAERDGEYADKDFNGTIFEQTLGVKATVNKTLSSAPIRISASYLFKMSRTRDLQVKRVWEWTEWPDRDNREGTAVDYDEGVHDIDYLNIIPIEYEVSGPWNQWAFSHAIQVGVNIWY